MSLLINPFPLHYYYFVHLLLPHQSHSPPLLHRFHPPPNYHSASFDIKRAFPPKQQSSTTSYSLILFQFSPTPLSSNTPPIIPYTASPFPPIPFQPSPIPSNTHQPAFPRESPPHFPS